MVKFSKMKEIFFILKGISNIFIQSVLLREIFSNFSGSEILFAFVISFYLSGSAFGSYFFRTSKKFKEHYIFLTIFESIFLIFSFIFLRLFTNIQQLYYISNLRFFYISFFLSFFIGFFEGSRFILLCFIFKKEKSSGKFYGLEGTGFLIGGALFFLLLCFEINIFFLIFIALILNSITFFQFSKKLAIYSFLIFLLLTPFSGKIEFKTISRKYPNYQIEKIKESFYNKLILLKSKNQFVLLSNGFQDFTSQPDQFSVKNISFFAVAFSKKIENIGIIGNPEIIDEIRKYKPEKIYYFEVDKDKVEIIKSYFLKDLKNVNFVLQDIGRFIKSKKIKFDSFIIVDTLPFSFKENYFLTDEFIKIISKFTEKLVVVLPGNYEYLGEQISSLHSSIYKTFKRYFKKEIIAFTYPLIIIFSNENLIVNEKNIYDRDFFNETYLNYVLDESKKNQYLQKILNEPSYINTISNQFCLYSSLSYYFSQTSPKIGNTIFKKFLKFFEFRKISNLVILIIFLFLFFLPVSTSHMIIFSNGFTAFAFEIIFIFLFQIKFGFLYGFISLITGIFMAGLSKGSFLSTLKIPDKKILFYSEIAFFLFYLISYFSLSNLKVPLIFIFFIGFLVGWEFGIISFLTKKESIIDITGKLYSIDLIGALISSISLPLFFIPAFGIFSFLFFLPVIKFSTLLRLIFLPILKNLL